LREKLLWVGSKSEQSRTGEQPVSSDYSTATKQFLACESTQPIWFYGVNLFNPRRYEFLIKVCD
jgi:hypothetical protein